MIPRCICTSGLSGWRQSLQKNYGTFDDWEWHADTYGLHTRLGFKSPREAWDANPGIQGSVNPSDFQIAPTHQHARRQRSR
jgi:hypothetical protein